MEEPRRAQRPVGEDGAITRGYGLNGVIAGEQPLAPLCFGSGHQRFDLRQHLRQRGGGLRRGGAITLQVIVERRQIHQQVVRRTRA